MGLWRDYAFSEHATRHGSRPATFRASFTSSPRVGGFSVSTFSVNPSFSSQNLTELGNPPGDTLTIALSQPIRFVSLDFQQYAPGI